MTMWVTWAERCAMSAVGVVVITTLAASASAQERSGFDAQTFAPVVSPGAVFSVDSAASAGHLQPYGAWMLGWANDPLVLEYEDGSREPVIDQQITGHLLGGLGFGDRYQVELGLPVIFSTRGSYEGASLAGAGVGDLTLRGKAQILRLAGGRFGLGAGFGLSLPTGDALAYRGAGAVSAHPEVLADYRIDSPAGPLVLSANLGARLQGVKEVHDLRIGPGLTYGVGAELEAVADVLFVGAELFGASVLVDPAITTSPLEALVGVRWALTEHLSVTLAGGGGLVSGVGSAAQRGLVGLSWRPDGAPERAAARPPACAVQTPPDYQGPRDEQGCALVAPQGCESLAADWTGAVDAQGCPLLDQDGDGILDAEDACPTEAADFDGLGAGDGCPEDDVDEDGVLDLDDRCPEVPGLRTHQGCPPPVQKAVREDNAIRILDKVFFQTDKAVIVEASFELLDQVALILRTNPDILLLEVAGHTDRRGDAEYNEMLSEERAKAVREYLVSQGVDASRIVARGYGSGQLLDESDTDEAHAANRRVEFRILEQGDEGGPSRAP
ncbi:hypothetical protein DL240_09915 [Lujinxingia litoralis]|uniref:OmpA-like domain-containing protein n=1 Tax=Lujinxingia litoralis TaxID=2211119 RepID=A0A328C5Q1_9DELT|nr:OmpA family protein [Lujinxingia litoralis]RAL22162.1 hypothetical protein DL240_09915 [Lujinxingia litoralis]